MCEDQVSAVISSKLAEGLDHLDLVEGFAVWVRPRRSDFRKLSPSVSAHSDLLDGPTTT